MERVIVDRLVVLLVAAVSLNVLWYGSGAVEALAVSHSTRATAVVGRMAAANVGDYARHLDLLVAPLGPPSPSMIQHVVYRVGELGSRWSVE
jgi:hypothetical protein